MCALDRALMAHTRPVARCRARLTRPKLPVPSTCPTSKSSSRQDSSLSSCEEDRQRQVAQIRQGGAGCAAGGQRQREAVRWPGCATAAAGAQRTLKVSSSLAAASFCASNCSCCCFCCAASGCAADCCWPSLALFAVGGGGATTCAQRSGGTREAGVANLFDWCRATGAGLSPPWRTSRGLKAGAERVGNTSGGRSGPRGVA